MHLVYNGVSRLKTFCQMNYTNLKVDGRTYGCCYEMVTNTIKRYSYYAQSSNFVQCFTHLKYSYTNRLIGSWLPWSVCLHYVITSGCYFCFKSLLFRRCFDHWYVVFRSQVRYTLAFNTFIGYMN